MERLQSLQSHHVGWNLGSQLFHCKIMRMCDKCAVVCKCAGYSRSHLRESHNKVYMQTCLTEILFWRTTKNTAGVQIL